MSRFNRLMQEDISVKSMTGTDYTGGKTYAAAATIKGRLDWQRSRVLNSQGEESLSEAVIYTTTRLKPGDLVSVNGTDWEVKAVKQQKGLYGATDHWEVRL